MATYFELMPAFSQIEDGNGNPLSGGKLNFYIAGTSTRKDTFRESDGVTANANPIVLDSNGYPPYGVWGTTGAYKIVLTDSADVVIRTRDNVLGVGDSTTASGSPRVMGLTGANNAIRRSGDARATVAAVYQANPDRGAWWNADEQHQHSRASSEWPRPVELVHGFDLDLPVLHLQRHDARHDIERICSCNWSDIAERVHALGLHRRLVRQQRRHDRTSADSRQPPVLRAGAKHPERGDGDIGNRAITHDAYPADCKRRVREPVYVVDHG